MTLKYQLQSLTDSSLHSLSSNKFEGTRQSVSYLYDYFFLICCTYLYMYCCVVLVIMLLLLYYCVVYYDATYCVLCVACGCIPRMAMPIVGRLNYQSINRSIIGTYVFGSYIASCQTNIAISCCSTNVAMLKEKNT